MWATRTELVDCDDREIREKGRQQTRRELEMKRWQGSVTCSVSNSLSSNLLSSTKEP